MRQILLKISKCILLLFVIQTSLKAQIATAPTTGDGSSGNPYQISTPDNLYWMHYQVNFNSNNFSGKYFKQMNHIDASATSTWFSASGWRPIGTSDDSNFTTYKAFSGNYNGQSYVISNLSINTGSANGYGLFGVIKDASISNVGLTGVSIIITRDAAYFTGALVGAILGTSSVTNCYSAGSVSGGYETGGLIGRNGDGTGIVTISNCNSRCKVASLRSYTGGLIGISKKGTISNCYSTGDVSVATAFYYAGGLIGQNEINSNLNACYSTSNVSGGSTQAFGGLIASNSGNVSNCYATGSVTSAGTIVGGLIGGHYPLSGSVSNCYSKGSVSGSDPTYKGGLIGYYSTGPNNVTNSFWDIETSGQTISPGGGTAKTTIQMKTGTTFTGATWDFAVEVINGTNNYWNIDAVKNNGYPYLSWQLFPSLPSVTTTAITIADNISVTLGGNVTAAGGGNVSDRGVVYSSTDNTPTIAEGAKSSSIGSGTGSFSSQITGLLNKTIYYVRAYAVNESGISYGTVQTFTPSAEIDIKGGSSSIPDETITISSDTDFGSVNADGATVVYTYTILNSGKADLSIGAITISGTNASDFTVSANPSSSVQAGLGSDPLPTIAGSATKNINGTGTGSFSRLISGLTAGKIYYVQAYAINGAGTSYGGAESFSTATFTWDGSESSDWNNAANWRSNLTPSASDNIVIVNMTNDPLINIINASCNDLIIGQGAVLTIAPGKSFTVNGTVANLSETVGLYLKSDATGDGSYMGPATNATVERYLPASSWILLSSPVASAINSLYTGMYMKQYSEAMDAFGSLITATNVALTPGTGSVVWATSASTVSYTGTTNGGTVSLTAPYSNQGFTLAGNPFPSFLDWNAASGFTKTNIAGTIWIWDQSLNSGAGNYTYYNSASGGTGNRYLAPGQGFFIQSASGGGSLAVSSGAQVHQQTGISLRSAQTAPELMNIRVFNDIYSDQALIAMIPDAIPSYDFRYDAQKMVGPEITPQLSVSKDGKIMSIASFSSIDSTMLIPLSLKAGTSGTYTLSITNNIDLGGLHIFLLDKILNTVTRIDDQGAVGISAAPSDITDRFTLLFSNKSVITDIGKSENKSGTIRIWNSGRKLNIEIPSNEELVNVEIYNLNGIKVKSFTSGSLRDIDLNLNTGMYVVRVKTTKQVQISKIVLY